MLLSFSFSFSFGVRGHCDHMHPFSVLGLIFLGQVLIFVVVLVAWYTSNYLSPTIYIF